MWKNLKRFLQTAMGSTVGVYLGRRLWLWQDYKARPGLYAMAGSPWYLPLLAGALVAAGLLLVEGWGLFLVNRHIKKKQDAKAPGPGKGTQED